MAIQPVEDGAEVEDPYALTQQTKQPTAPVAATPTGPSGPTPVAPTPSATSPLPYTAPQAVPPVSASDPLAFSGGTPLSAINPQAPAGGAPLQAGQQAGPTQGWVDPFTSMSEAEKTAYWAGQGTQGLAGVGYQAPAITQAGVGGGTQQGYDPAANAAATQQYLANNQPLISDVTKRVQDAQNTANAGAAPIAPSTLDQWWAQHGGGDRISNVNGTQVDSARNMYDTLSKLPLDQQAGYNIGDPALQADFQRATDANLAVHNEHIGAGLPSVPASAPSSALRPGAPSDAGGGALPSQAASLPLSAVGAQGSAPGLPSAPGSAGGNPSTPGATSGTGGAGVNLTPTTPGNALTNQTISPGQGLDRFKIAQDQYNAAKAASEPGYQADLQEANRNAFGAGRGVSGMLRTTRGNIASDRQNTLAKQQSDFLNGALTGSIEDSYRNLGIAQQQQGFQNTQEQEAFANAIQQALAQEQLTNGAFGRAQGQEQAGYSNSPADIALILSQIFGGQSSAAGQSASQLFSQAGQSGQPNPLLDYLKQLGIGGTTPPSDNSGQTPGYPGVN